MFGSAMVELQNLTVFSAIETTKKLTAEKAVTPMGGEASIVVGLRPDKLQPSFIS